MAFIAFEVFLNGERQFTAGREKWESILAVAHAQRVDPDVSKLLLRDDEKSSDPSLDIRFRTHVSEPSDEEPITTFDGLQIQHVKTGTYPSFSLSAGDVVEIRVVHSESADVPEWSNPNPESRPAFRSFGGI